MTIIDAIKDRRLFGGLPPFRDNLQSWRRWLTFLKATYGLPLDAEDLAIFRHHTGRTTYDPPPGGWREVVGVVGRQSGKTRIAALIASFEAATATAERDGTSIYALLISQDSRAAMRTLFGYTRACFEKSAVLRRAVVARRAETLSLDSGVVVSIYPCRPASVRGIRARVAVVDELAFFRSSEGFPTDVEMLRAVRPCLATTGGKLIVLSSPYGQSGALYDLHRAHLGQDDAPVLVWQASAPEMNPLLPADYLRRMALDDAEAYRSEVLGEFRAGLSTLLDPDAIAACVATGVRERAPQLGVRYVVFADPSGGRSDAFTIAVAHQHHSRSILDLVRAWKAPFDPASVVAEAADIVHAYGLSRIVGDRFSAEFVTSAFRAHGVVYEASERDRSTLYLELLPLVNAGRVELLDQPEMLRELRGLERRRGSSGRDRVDHGPSAHDDLSNSAAGALGLAAVGVVDEAAITRAIRWSSEAPPPPGQTTSTLSDFGGVSGGFDLDALTKAFGTRR